LREVADGLLPENRVGSKFLLPARPSLGQAAQRLSSRRRPRRYNHRERSFRRNRRRRAWAEAIRELAGPTELLDQANDNITNTPKILRSGLTVNIGPDPAVQ